MGSTAPSVSHGSSTAQGSPHEHSSLSQGRSSNAAVQIHSGAQAPADFPRAIPLPSRLALSTSLATHANRQAGFDLIYTVNGNLVTAI